MFYIGIGPNNVDLSSLLCVVNKSFEQSQSRLTYATEYTSVRCNKHECTKLQQYSTKEQGPVVGSCEHGNERDLRLFTAEKIQV